MSGDETGGLRGGLEVRGGGALQHAVDDGARQVPHRHARRRAAQRVAVRHSAILHYEITHHSTSCCSQFCSCGIIAFGRIWNYWLIAFSDVYSLKLDAK